MGIILPMRLTQYSAKSNIDYLLLICVMERIIVAKLFASSSTAISIEKSKFNSSVNAVD